MFMHQMDMVGEIKPHELLLRDDLPCLDELNLYAREVHISLYNLFEEISKKNMYQLMRGSTQRLLIEEIEKKKSIN